MSEANPLAASVMVLLALMVVAFPAEALAHASDRGHMLLLPTGHYIAGGAAAVALSFLVLALVPQKPLDLMARWRFPVATLPGRLRLGGSMLSFLFLLFLLATGFFGAPDPLINPLPLVVWAVFWVGLTLMQSLIGDFWHWLNPWYAPWRMLTRLSGRLGGGRSGLYALPQQWGYLPAIIQFFAFAWFELVHPSPDNPLVLASAISLYFTFNLAAMLVFGHEEWARRCECMSAFLRMMARLAVIDGQDMACGGRRLFLCLPGARLLSALPLPTSGALFLLLALSSVSFDGLMRTFFWLGLIGVNPLEFPGRSAVILSSTVGLAAAFVLLGCAFFVAVALGEWLAGKTNSTREAAGVLVWSIVPIATAYHIAHYLPSLMIDIQYALAALADPFHTRTDLYGSAHLHVHAGVLMGADRVWMIWNLQAFAIVGGHLLAVLVAHVAAFRLHGTAKNTAYSQLPLAVLMVFYTMLGLWLLAAPNAG